jgi:prepilin-type N-terminal cleavage/methylation domain-containing protein/prepilin-type processing-associated H-X9-DG protein
MTRNISNVVCHSSRDSRRYGFTAVELLVCITIAAVLLGLLIPGIQSARDASRLLVCRNNLRQQALALLQWHDVRGQFPPATTHGAPLPQPHHGPMKNWVVDILPWLDQRSITDSWDASLPSTSLHNEQLAETHIPVLACPSDVSVVGKGDLSYAVPGGLGTTMGDLIGRRAIFDAFERRIDLNGDGVFFQWDPAARDATPNDLQISVWIGLFGHDNRAPNVGTDGLPRRNTIATITDGASNTLLITENIRTGYDPRERYTNWANSDRMRAFVFLSPEICRNNQCNTASVDFTLANSGGHAINSGHNRAEGTSPWPTSFHKGGVNVGLCDGSVKFLSQSTAGGPYFSLFTPAGNRLSGTPLAETEFLNQIW